MSQWDRLDDDGFESFAMRHYDNPQCSGREEFEDDLERIKYVKLLLRKYRRRGVLRERLIMNHIITLANVFGATPASRMLFYRIEPDLHSFLKTFLKHLDYLPDSIPEAKLETINCDANIAKSLTRI